MPLQSDSASVEIPELELELAPGTLGGLVTTVEGLLTNISESKYEDLVNIFVHASKDVTLLVLCFGCHIKETCYLFPT
jgi:C4-type Zn-finger protein